MTDAADIRLGAAIAAGSTHRDRGRKEPKGCRWISGDVRSGAWHYCQAEATGPYCPEHAAKAGKLYTGRGATR